MITVNMEKAREVKRNQIRTQRKPIIEELDVAYIRAQESGDTAKMNEVVSKKQALRDATESPEIDAATTPDELKAFVPEVIDAYQQAQQEAV